MPRAEPLDYWQVAESVCTQEELDAIKLRDGHGHGARMIGLMVGVSRSAIRDRLASADARIAARLEAESADLPRRGITPT